MRCQSFRSICALVSCSCVLRPASSSVLWCGEIRAVGYRDNKSFNREEARINMFSKDYPNKSKTVDEKNGEDRWNNESFCET